MVHLPADAAQQFLQKLETFLNAIPIKEQALNKYLVCMFLLACVANQPRHFTLTVLLFALLIKMSESFPLDSTEGICCFYNITDILLRTFIQRQNVLDTS